MADIARLKEGADELLAQIELMECILGEWSVARLAGVEDDPDCRHRSYAAMIETAADTMIVLAHIFKAEVRDA